MSRFVCGVLGLAVALVVSGSPGMRSSSGPAAPRPPYPPPAAITIEYPPDAAVFPPEMSAPTFLWRDEAVSASSWSVEVSFEDGAIPLRILTQGERPRIGDIDPRCVADTNELPRLPPPLASARSWTPDDETWAAIKLRSVERAATVTISGYASEESSRLLSQGRMTLLTSSDPVGAPIFYRDVPLMPTESEPGVIKPIVPSAVPLISWRLRYVGETKSRLIMENLPTCANCHSFSLDGRTMGMDVDGPQNDKGMYAIAAINPRTSIRTQDVFSWNSFAGKPPGHRTIGFMAQVSPDGQHAATTLNEAMYVVNFKDFRFLQVFYPTRGIIALYDRATGRMRSLPGADNPNFVQTDAVWGPDGSYLVFVRALAKDPYPPGRKLAEYPNSPDEVPIKYDLYRVPFNSGKGGRITSVAGASHNGMSNTFPKVSPDGRWIVFVQCRNGQLMRPDGQLYIVPSAGGQARRMRCNTPLMNSWHSFSPNGRWLVFTSKSRSPYTQLFLTHVDRDGNDSPAILIENATASNRAVNLPEFVNIPVGGLEKIDVPAVEFYRLVESAWKLADEGRLAESVAEWRKALEINPGDVKARNNLGAALQRSGNEEEAIEEWERVLKLSPDYIEAHNNLGATQLRRGNFADAISHLRRVLDANPGNAPVRNELAAGLYNMGKTEEAIRQWRRVLKTAPGLVAARFSLGNALYARGRAAEALAQWLEGLRAEPNRVAVLERTAWVLATCPDDGVRNGAEAVDLAERAVRLSANQPSLLDTLAAAYAESGRFQDAVRVLRLALDIVSRQTASAPAASLKARLALYESGVPFRDSR